MYKIIKHINPNIFRGYDLRGVMGKDLDEDVYYTLGKAYGTFLGKRRILSAAVGYDNRHNGPAYCQAFITGLNETGIDTFEIGPSLSQIIYYSSYHFKTKGGVIITASHNPEEYNGLKLSIGYSDTFITEEIQELRAIAAAGEFTKGLGKNIKKDIFQDYKQEILKLFSLNKNWKIVIDGCNTNSGIFYPPIFREAGCEVIEQNCQPDSDFPLGDPDPTASEVLERLAKGVKQHRADLGFAFDADGDRMAVVDEKGQILWMDTIVALFAQDVLEFLPGKPIVYNTLCSKQVTDTIVEAGGKPLMWKTGHSFIKAKVKEARSPFGGELSGHIFFTDNFFGHDDAANACLRLLAFLERREETLSQAVGHLNQYVSSPEIKVGLADEIKFKFIDEKIYQELKALWPKADCIKIDGVRIDTPDEMVTIRASQNGPYITIKFEGKTQEQYNQLKVTLKKILTKYDEIDWDSGVNIQALD